VSTDGFNTEVEREGFVFHVQTQDKGPGANYVESFIYLSGKLVSSRKAFYTPYLGHPQLQGEIRRIMEEQHQKILREIGEGRFDHFLS
jgi:hypothetical protein